MPPSASWFSFGVQELRVNQRDKDVHTAIGGINEACSADGALEANVALLTEQQDALGDRDSVTPPLRDWAAVFAELEGMDDDGKNHRMIHAP
jgi:hypothetical protein